MLRRLATLAVLLALAGPAGQALAQQALSPEQRSAVEGLIGEYLVKNPDVMRRALDEMLRHEETAQREGQKAAMRELKDEMLKPATGIVLGAPDGDVTLVEFSDYNCGYCKQALGDLRALVKADPKLRIIVRDVDFVGGPSSGDANRVALAVRRQAPEKLADFHVRLMETRGRVTGARALDVAREIGLDLTRLKADGAAAEIDATLRANKDMASKLGVNGTPAFILGETLISGAVGLEPLRQAVADMRRCGQASC